MKLFKRVLAMAVSAALLCPITAYAAPEDDTRAMLRQVLEQQQAVTDLNAFYDFDITVSGSALETETMTVRLEMNTKMNGMNDPDNMKMMSYMRVTDAAGTEVTGTMYYVDGYSYVDMLGQKQRTAMPMDQMMSTMDLASLDAAGSVDKSMEMLKEVGRRPEGNDTVITYTMDAPALNALVDEVFVAAGLGEVGFEIGSVKGEYVINSEGQCVKERMKMIMDMDAEGETLRITIDGDVGIADPGQPVEVPMPNPAEYTDI